MYQFLSVKQLGNELSRRKPRLQKNFRSYEKADGPMQIEKREIKEKEIIVLDNQMFVRGVLPDKQRFYKPSNKNTFVCLKSGEEISYNFVNDNYCDCSDFSDEPSTSACNLGQFYCNHQSNKSPLSIISYKVNDGICDCCDGSDEWEQSILPPHVILPVNKQKVILQAPCPNHCIG